MLNSVLTSFLQFLVFLKTLDDNISRNSGKAENCVQVSEVHSKLHISSCLSLVRQLLLIKLSYKTIHFINLVTSTQCDLLYPIESQHLMYSIESQLPTVPY